MSDKRREQEVIISVTLRKAHVQESCPGDTCSDGVCHEDAVALDGGEDPGNDKGEEQ